MFITAPCVLYLIKQRWSKNKSSYVKAIFLFMAPLKSYEPTPPPPPPLPNIVGSLEFLFNGNDIWVFFSSALFYPVLQKFSQGSRMISERLRWKKHLCGQLGKVNTAAIRQPRIIYLLTPTKASYLQSSWPIHVYRWMSFLFSKRREIQIYRYSEHNITYTAQKPGTRHRSNEKGEKKSACDASWAVVWGGDVCPQANKAIWEGWLYTSKKRLWLPAGER